MSTRTQRPPLREQRDRDWWRLQAPAPAWLAQLEARQQVAVAASLEPGLTLILDADETLSIRAELALPRGTPGTECEAGVAARRGRLARAAAPNSLRPVPLPSVPDAAGREALASVCAELEGDPAATACELDPVLRGFSLYPRSDGSYQVAFDAKPGTTALPLPFCSLRATAEGGCTLTVDLAVLSEDEPECANAAALAALRAASVARSVGARAIALERAPTTAASARSQLALAVELDPPIDAHFVGLALCSLEHAAIACAREVALLSSDRDLARKYLAICASPTQTQGATGD